MSAHWWVGRCSHAVAVCIAGATSPAGNHEERKQGGRHPFGQPAASLCQNRQPDILCPSCVLPLIDTRLPIFKECRQRLVIACHLLCSFDRSLRDFS
jgi:hypothetical protein